MIVANGSTDVTTYFVLRDSAAHAPKTDVTVANIDLYYVEQGAAISTKADVTAHSAATDAHTDNYGFHVGQGLYRIDWPDAAFDGGVGKHVILIVVCAGVDTTFLDVELSPRASTAIRKNRALAKFSFIMRDSTNHAPATGKSPTVTRSLDGAAFDAGTLANTAELSNGVYLVDFAAADLNANVITLRATAAACDDTFVTLVTTD